MKVARQFIAWKSDHGAPSRRVRYDVTTWRLHRPDHADRRAGIAQNVWAPTNHTVPYGTGRFFGLFQAINCQATITTSLPDIPLLLPRLFIPLRDALVNR